MSLLDLLPKLFIQDKQKPTPRWKNRYLATRSGHAFCGTCGMLTYVQSGEDLISHCRTYGSKAEAEAEARLWMHDPRSKGWKWLGAIPVDPE